MQCGAYLYLPIAVEKCRQHELWVYSCSSLWPQVLRTRRASQAILARVEECLPSLPTYTLDRHLARLKAFGDFEHKEILMAHSVSPTWPQGMAPPCCIWPAAWASPIWRCEFWSAVPMWPWSIATLEHR